MASYLVTIKDGQARKFVKKKLVNVLKSSPNTHLKLASKKPQIWQISSTNRAHDKLFARLRQLAIVSVVFVSHELEPDAVPQTSLLTLPAEMRNRIYRSSLVETNTIVIDPGKQRPTPPGLLQVCRQIRDEARGIYFAENTFKFVVRENDATILMDWSSLSPEHAEVEARMDLGESANWPNLVKWMESYYNAGCGGPVLDDGVEEDDGVAAGPRVARHLFRMLIGMKAAGMTWTQVLEVLEPVRKVVTVYDSNWADEGDDDDSDD